MAWLNSNVWEKNLQSDRDRKLRKKIFETQKQITELENWQGGPAIEKESTIIRLRKRLAKLKGGKTGSESPFR
jgi:Zn-dependent oligopeptidase